MSVSRGNTLVHVGKSVHHWKIELMGKYYSEAKSRFWRYVNMTILSFNTESYVTQQKSEVASKFHFLLCWWKFDPVYWHWGENVVKSPTVSKKSLFYCVVYQCVDDAVKCWQFYYRHITKWLWRKYYCHSEKSRFLCWDICHACLVSDHISFWKSDVCITCTCELCDGNICPSVWHPARPANGSRRR